MQVQQKVQVTEQRNERCTYTTIKEKVDFIVVITRV